METPLLKFQQKYEREREKARERKFGISAMALPKFLLPKKLTETNCGNGIAEIGEKKFVAIVAMPLPKMGGKKKVVAEIWEELKKKKVLRTQYFYNKSHVISCY